MLKRILILSILLVMLFSVHSVEAATWVSVTRDAANNSSWFIDASNVRYERGLLCYTAQGVYDNVAQNGYKTLIGAYEVQEGNPSYARVVGIIFLDGTGNIIDQEEDPDSEQWVELTRGSIGYELTRYAKKYL